ncbi:hypothetical protein E2C01_064004 [Portunus trituberculatus]|uniref:Uncharacterized protein n=1 Tax=Portunus trituberculatus TaxID=210409 RepID=A0A5B7HHY8_PORTR|nr:hypothetical protein [Portunus trituberculatus]
MYSPELRGWRWRCVMVPHYRPPYCEPSHFSQHCANIWMLYGHRDAVGGCGHKDAVGECRHREALGACGYKETVGGCAWPQGSCWRVCMGTGKLWEGVHGHREAVGGCGTK